VHTDAPANENVPAAHAVRSLPPAQLDPAVQVAQLDAPLARLYTPGAHDTHEVAAVDEAIVPAAHGVHTDRPVAAAYVPVAHAVQDAAELLLDTYPKLHAVQTDAPPDAYVPAAHAVWLLPPAQL